MNSSSPRIAKRKPYFVALSISCSKYVSQMAGPTASRARAVGTGGLAMLIPPSALAVLLAILDVDDLLLAGVVPRTMLACLYVILILVMCL